jgi:hypothetical protein
VQLGDEPVAAIVVALHEADGADDLTGRSFKAQGPVPLFAARDGGKSVIAVPVDGGVRRERPRNLGVEVANDLPLREEQLDLLCVADREWAQQ